jgi:hypothetical protein
MQYARRVGFYWYPLVEPKKSCKSRTVKIPDREKLKLFHLF